MNPDDIIERLARKLQLQDRLSWNDDRRGGLEHRTITTSLVFGYVPGPGSIKTPTQLQWTNIRSLAILHNHHNSGNNIQEDVMYRHIMALGPLRDKKTSQLPKRRQTIFVSNVKVHIVYTRVHSSKPSQWGKGQRS